MLMLNSAIDWITTLTPEDPYSYAAVKRAFTENYLPSPQLRWIEIAQYGGIFNDVLRKLMSF